MNPFEMVVLIVFIIMVGKVLSGRSGHRGRSRDRAEGLAPAENAETLRLREEVAALKERIHVLERIAVEKEDTLSRQIEELRDR